MIDRRLAGACLLALVAAVSLPAAAQFLYKLIDRQGRVTYSDREPKDFDGTVVRIETDAAANIVPSAKAGAAPPRAGGVSAWSEERRRNREELEQKLRAAQDRVEAARKAKAEGGEPLPDELQTIQRHGAPLKSGEQARNPNCFASTAPSGAASLNCPSRVPADAYYERQKKLEDDLAKAEEALALAERAFRRGTD